MFTCHFHTLIRGIKESVLYHQGRDSAWEAGNLVREDSTVLPSVLLFLASASVTCVSVTVAANCLFMLLL